MVSAGYVTPPRGEAAPHAQEAPLIGPSALFEADRHNQYVRFLQPRRSGGRYRDRPNVREVVVRGRGKLPWDQVLVPLAARRENLDVPFHHRFSIPLLPPCPVVVQQRGTVGELRRRGLLRAATFTWTRSAETLLSELRAAAGPRRVARAG